MNSREARILAGDGAGLPSRQAYLNPEAVRAQKVRLALRAEHGRDWDGTADNDNIAWPLAKALLAEGNEELLKYAMKYRRIYDQAKSDAQLGGSGVSLKDGFSLDQRTVIKANGNIAYKGVRVVSSGDPKDTAPMMKVMPFAVDESGIERNAIKVPRVWNGDRPVNDMIDAKTLLHQLQMALGPVCEPFEMACIDAATLAEVGAASGASSRDGKPAAGRAICHLALITIRDMLGAIGRSDIKLDT